MSHLFVRRAGWAVLLLLICTNPVSADPTGGSKAASKLLRGVVNTVTGWAEIPKCIQEDAQDAGMGAGLTWGLLRGVGHGLVRTAAGVYELVTFPVPAPPEYEPVIDPPYVFSFTPPTTD